MDSPLWYIRGALRSLWRSSHFSLFVILCLALGLGVNTAVFGCIDAVLLRALPYRDPDRLAILWGSKNLESRPGLSIPDVNDWKSQSGVFQDLASFQSGFALNVSSARAMVAAAGVDAQLFTILGVRPVLGRTLDARDDEAGAPRAVVLSNDLWRSFFGGDQNIAGRRLRLGEQDYTIVGVMPADFFFPDGTVQLWIPLRQAVADMNRRGVPLVHALGRLSDGVTASQAQVAVDVVTARLREAYPETDQLVKAGVFPFARVLTGNYRTAFWTILGATFLLVLIACANASNLLLARGIAREKELATRMALGATRGQVAAHLAAEGLLLSLGGGLVGIGGAYGGIALVRALALSDIPALSRAALNGRVLIFALVVSILCGVIFSVVPLWTFSRMNLMASLKLGGVTSSQSGKRRLSDLLVVGEISLSIILLVMAGLLVSSFVRLKRIAWGFDPAHVLAANLTLPSSFSATALQLQFSEAVVSRARQLPGVVSATAAYGVPLDYGAYRPTRLAVDGQFATRGWVADSWFVGQDYFRTMGIPLLRGREFTSADPARETAVVSRDLAGRLWPGQDPVGRRIQVLELRKDLRKKLELSGSLRMDEADSFNPGSWEPAGQPVTVIGEVADVRMFGAEWATGHPAMYLLLASQDRPISTFLKFAVRTSGDPLKLDRAIRDIVVSTEPSASIGNVSSMEEMVNRSIGGRGSNKMLLATSTAFAAIALLLAALGLYALMRHSVEQRTRELAIRIACGAPRRAILELILRRSVALILAGLGIGLAVSIASAGVLSRYLFGVRPTDLPTLIIVSGLILLVGLAASAAPAFRAATTEPWITLHRE